MKQPDDKSRRSFLKASSMFGVAVALNSGTIGETFVGDLRSAFKSLR